ncbi:O-antigen ligase family protein [Cupriavidus sp. TMH.W2]|uniref:O-antigen ligase family protein n=1 Tax=Cupriavidus sp. TMH.W2 TaxID=3434465 RepID=UPI003D779FDD
MNSPKRGTVACVLAAGFIILSLIGIMTSSQSTYRAVVIIYLLILSTNRVALVCAIPYIFFSPVALMSDLPLIMAICCAIFFHALFSAVGNGLSVKFSSFGKSWTVSLLALILASLISAIISNNEIASLGALSIYVQGFFLLILLCVSVRGENEYQYLLVSICIASAFALVYKVFCYYSEIPPVLLSAAVDGGSSWESKAQIFLDSEFVKRLLWLGQEPNYTAALHFVPTAIAISLYAKAKRWKLLFLLCAAANAMQILGTLSRSGAVSLLLMMVLLVLFGGMKSKNKLQIGSAMILAVILLYSQVGYLFDRLGSIQSSVVSDGASGRFEFWGKAVELINQSPVFGIGPGGFRADVGDAAHNTYIEVIAELGFIGGVIYIAFVVFPVAYSVISKRRSDRIILIGYLSYLLMGMSISFYQFFLIVFMGFVCVRGYSSVRSSASHGGIYVM